MMMQCAAAECAEAGTQRCPTCVRLEIQPAAATYFCSQACFKTSWLAHKLLHKAPRAREVDLSAKRRRAAFESFAFTGDLRPADLVFPRRSVPAAIRAPDYAVDGKPRSEERFNGSSSRFRVLDAAGIEGMRTVCRLGREVLDIAVRAAKPGVSTEDIDVIVHKACVERNSYPSPLNYYGFPKSCCTSVNEVICHGIPDTRVLRDGDILNLDITLYHGGYHGDLNETVLVGACDDEGKKLVKSAYDCLWSAIKVVKPGTLFRELGAHVDKVARANGHSVVRTYCGHGINEEFHTAPNVPHYKKNKAVGVCKEGMTFTIEPMINEGAWRDKLWPDNWTAVTEDGKRSAQFEHTILVTADGYEVLTDRSPDGPKFWWE